MANGKQTEDVQGAIDALERRAAHLSNLVHPQPGERPYRTAHWRDEVELRAVRMGVKALRDRQARGPDNEAVVAMLTSCSELLAELRDSERVSPRLLARAEGLQERLDVMLEALT